MPLTYSHRSRTGKTVIGDRLYSHFRRIAHLRGIYGELPSCIAKHEISRAGSNCYANSRWGAAISQRIDGAEELKISSVGAPGDSCCWPQQFPSRRRLARLGEMLTRGGASPAGTSKILQTSQL